MKTKQPSLVPEAVRHASQSAMTVRCHQGTGPWLVLARGQVVAQGEDMVKVSYKCRDRDRDRLTPIGGVSRRAVGEESRLFAVAGLGLFQIHCRRQSLPSQAVPQVGGANVRQIQPTGLSVPRPGVEQGPHRRLGVLGQGAVLAGPKAWAQRQLRLQRVIQHKSLVVRAARANQVKLGAVMIGSPVGLLHMNRG